MRVYLYRGGLLLLNSVHKVASYLMAFEPELVT